MHSPTFCTQLRTRCFLKVDIILKLPIKFTDTLSVLLLQLIFLQNQWYFYRMPYNRVETAIVILLSIYLYILYTLYMCKFNLKLWNTVKSFLISKTKIRVTGYVLISLSSNRAKVFWALQLHCVSDSKSISHIWSFFQQWTLLPTLHSEPTRRKEKSVFLWIAFPTKRT